MESSPHWSPDRAKSKMGRAQRLLVGTTGDYKPLTWYDGGSGQFHGRDINMIEAFARDRGYELQFVHTSWPTMLGDLQDGKFQIAVGGISLTNERNEQALVSDNLAVTGKVALVRRGEEHKYQSLEEIDREGVVVVEDRGGTNETFALSHLRKAVLIIVPDNSMPFDYLIDGKADVMFTDATEAVYQESLNPSLYAVDPDRPLTRTAKVFLFERKESQLRDEFNNWHATRQSTVGDR